MLRSESEKKHENDLNKLNSFIGAQREQKVVITQSRLRLFAARIN